MMKMMTAEITDGVEAGREYNTHTQQTTAISDRHQQKEQKSSLLVSSVVAIEKGKSEQCAQSKDGALINSCSAQ